MNKTISNELKRLKHEVFEFKKICELNIIGALYKNTENIYHINLTLENFNYNVSKVYFTIIDQIILKEKKEDIDDITIGLYLEKHPKLKAKYEEYKGYQTILDAIDLVNDKNLDAYILENEKWMAVLKLLDYGMIVDLKQAVDLSAEEIYSIFEARINHIFLSVENEEKVYGLGDDIIDTIDEWDEGSAMGIPFHNSEILTSQTGGICMGEITLIGGLSGAGKSSFIRNTVIPSVIDVDEGIIYMVNEQGLKKAQREIIVWVANNIFKKDIQKYMVRNGGFSQELKDILLESGRWMMENSEIIKILPFTQYTKNNTIRTIRKYASLGFNYFVIDTFKLASDGNSAMIIKEMKKDMEDYYDLIKPASLNKSLICTFQLNKASTKMRYYTMDNIGESKSIIDVAGLCVMFRRLFPDELTGGKNELKVYKLEGKYKDRKVAIELSEEKDYFVMFIIKNREGASEAHQIVVEHDLSRNIYREVGICNVPVDF